MCITGLCEASTDVRRGESLIYGEVNASLMLMNFKPSDLPMALCENIAIFRRNIPCPWNLLQDRLIPGIVDGYRKVLGRVCIKAQSGIFCLQRRTMGMGPIPRWTKGALQIPAADLRPSSRKSDNILRCIWPARRPMETQEGQSNDQSACLLQSRLLIRCPPLLTIVLCLQPLSR